MVNFYDLKMDTGESVKLTFNFNFIVIASRIMEDKEKYPLSLDETFTEAAKIVDAGMISLSSLNRLVNLVYPFVFAGMQATKDREGGDPVTDTQALSVVRSIADPVSIGSIIGLAFNSIMPQGLPADPKKKAPVKKVVKRTGKK